MSAVDNASESVHRNPFPPTPMVELVDRALAKSGIAQKTASSFMRMDASQFSRALAGNGSLPLQKLELLPATFWKAFIELLAERFGLQVGQADKRDLVISRLVGAVTELLTLEKETRR